MEGYGDVDSWNWPPPSNTQPHAYPHVFDPTAVYANFTQQPSAPGSVHPRHHSIAASHVVNTGTSTPPPPRQQVAGTMVKAQPAFKPTWNGFLDTTKDAMSIVEAALQGRLSHISRRPHDKERAEMLRSGTVLVYEENASGIKRWTDAVHWSPSRVMNNCLIYRQLVRALKPEEKKSALNPTCGSKRKRKESAGPTITKTGENVNNSEDEYDNPAFDGNLPGDATPTDSMGKVYANFAQSLTPDQQRRYCGSLIDSYEFKEGGLMKKTISVKYQGTTHHIISYYSLEDVVAGKLKRPFQDPELADIHPRPELLTGWKVSLEDEESKEVPLVTGYSHQLQSSHIQHQPVASVSQGMGAHGIPHYHNPPQPQHYYVQEAKYVPDQKYTTGQHYGY
ncbi:camp independent regulatory protein [Trematosphaeria pertusa]|uniref:Camp independent regulatory protein n=1 Tax=Trematosphaeria pertusa TaxID=390896 RepID=A0A6A6IXM1_9PLEO|nr:camp independent regulatory protein [Trematosphaeria pertusa]KAF2253933.1 camp independent regulatory protein [Trematosphaeria pertusa]